MVSVTIEYENGQKVTLYATQDDLSVFVTNMRKLEHIKEVYIN